MVDRVLLGTKGGQSGLWISKPGINVNTATADQLLLSTDFGGMQIVSAGTVTVAYGGTVSVSVPDLGYTPCVALTISPRVSVQDFGPSGKFGLPNTARYRMTSATTMELSVFAQSELESSFQVTYTVFARPLDG